MEKKYVAIDIEASGRTPGKYSMLSFGAAIVFDSDKQFYRELKPINENYIHGNMEIGCLGLKCIEDLSEDCYNPKNKLFKPDLVLKVLQVKGQNPSKAMSEFNDWILESTKGFIPIMAAVPTSFDCMFITYYFDNFFDGKDPFGHNSEDFGSMYRMYKRDVNASFKEMEQVTKTGHTHNALDDAVEYAKQFEKLLEMMKSG